MAVRGTADVYKGWHFGLTGPRRSASGDSPSRCRGVL